MYADCKIVGVDLYNVHLIGLCLLLAAATCVFCESARPDGSSARPLPVAGPAFLTNPCPARQSLEKKCGVVGVCGGRKWSRQT